VDSVHLRADAKPTRQEIWDRSWAEVVLGYRKGEQRPQEKKSGERKYSHQILTFTDNGVKEIQLIDLRYGAQGPASRLKKCLPLL
jgi:hypothetical protein